MPTYAIRPTISLTSWLNAENPSILGSASSKYPYLACHEHSFTLDSIFLESAWLRDPERARKMLKIGTQCSRHMQLQTRDAPLADKCWFFTVAPSFTLVDSLHLAKVSLSPGQPDPHCKSELKPRPVNIFKLLLPVKHRPGRNRPAISLSLHFLWDLRLFLLTFLLFYDTASCSNPAQLLQFTFMAITLERLVRLGSNFHTMHSFLCSFD